MLNEIAKRIVYPALYWAAFVGSAFIGIGGMSEQAAPDPAIRFLWIDAAVVVALTFVTALVVFALRWQKTRIEIHEHTVL